MLMKAHEVMTPDRPIKYHGRQCVKVHAHGRRGFKFGLPQEYFDSIATAMEMVVAGHELSLRARKLGQVGKEQRMLGACDHSRYSAGVGKTAVHDQRCAGDTHAVNKLSR